MTLGDKTGDEVRGDYAALRVGSEEDGVGAAEIVDPSGVGKVGFVQPIISVMPFSLSSISLRCAAML